MSEPTFCPHINYHRASRAYKCDDCGFPIVIHSVPMTLDQVINFEKMRRGQESKNRRRKVGLVLPGEKVARLDFPDYQ